MRRRAELTPIALHGSELLLKHQFEVQEHIRSEGARSITPLRRRMAVAQDRLHERPAAGGPRTKSRMTSARHRTVILMEVLQRGNEHNFGFYRSDCSLDELDEIRLRYGVESQVMGLAFEPHLVVLCSQH